MSTPPKATIGIGQLMVVRENISGYRNVESYSALLAEGAPNDSSLLVRVTNDPDPALNRTYEWNGELWVQSPYDPVNAANAYTDARIDEIADSVAATADAEEFLQSYLDEVALNVTFPLDCGLITDPSIYNTFDLGAL